MTKFLLFLQIIFLQGLLNACTGCYKMTAFIAKITNTSSDPKSKFYSQSITLETVCDCCHKVFAVKSHLIPFSSDFSDDQARRKIYFLGLSDASNLWSFVKEKQDSIAKYNRLASGLFQDEQRLSTLREAARTTNQHGLTNIDLDGIRFKRPSDFSGKTYALETKQLVAWCLGGAAIGASLALVVKAWEKKRG